MGTDLCGRQLISFDLLPAVACPVCLLKQTQTQRPVGDQRTGLGLVTPGPLSRGKFSQRGCNAALRAVDSDLAKREGVNFAERVSDHHFVVI